MRVFARSPVSVSVSWDSPAAVGSDVLGYRVYYYDIGSADPQEAELNVTDNTCALGSLRKFGEYSVRVVAYSAIGAGTSTQELYFRTLSDSRYHSSL